VLANKCHRRVMVAQPVMRAHFVPHGGHGMEAVRDKIGFVVVDRGEDTGARRKWHELSPKYLIITILVPKARFTTKTPRHKVAQKVSEVFCVLGVFEPWW
jgi:hypothetical protein